jgi:hypothetical protein
MFTYMRKFFDSNSKRCVPGQLPSTWLIVALLLLCACTPSTFEGALYDLGALEQPESPLIPGTNATLADNRWRLTTLTYQNEPISLEGLETFYLVFHESGRLLMWIGDCPAGAYYIIATTTTTYRLLPAPSPAVLCTDVPEIQQRWDEIRSMLSVTYEYRLEDDELILLGRQMGNEVEATFVADTPE